MGPLSADTAIGMTLELVVEMADFLGQWFYQVNYLAATLLDKPHTYEARTLI